MNLHSGRIEDYPVEPRRFDKHFGVVRPKNEYVVTDLDFTFSQAFTESNELKPPLCVSALVWVQAAALSIPAQAAALGLGAVDVPAAALP